MATDILMERRDGGRLAIVTINRPQRRNACDLQAWTDLRDTFLELARDASVRLVVLTGAGGHFCAGDDILAFREALSDPVRADAYRSVIQACFAAVQDAPMPVIAALSGVCVGGGASLALCCDFRVGDETARVSVPVAKLGLVYPTIQLVRLSHLIGVSAARQWLYTGKFVGGAEARAAGFIDALAARDPVEEALRFGADMMDNAPLSIAGSKMQLNAISAGAVAEQRARIEEIFDRANNSEDYRNAATAFAQKRKPVFLGR
jgi:enoyl-CoA hydratase/carnithine racemase